MVDIPNQIDKEPRTNQMGNGTQSNCLKLWKNVLLGILNKSPNGPNKLLRLVFELWDLAVPDYSYYLLLISCDKEYNYTFQNQIYVYSLISLIGNVHFSYV